MKPPSLNRHRFAIEYLYKSVKHHPIPGTVLNIVMYLLHDTLPYFHILIYYNMMQKCVSCFRDRLSIWINFCFLIVLQLSVADLGGRRPPPSDQIFLDFMQFSGKFNKIVSWCPPLGVCTPPGKILDPPLIMNVIWYSFTLEMRRPR